MATIVCWPLVTAWVGGWPGLAWSWPAVFSLSIGVVLMIGPVLHAWRRVASCQPVTEIIVAILLFFLLPVRKLIQNTTSIQAHLHSHVDMILSVCVCRSYTVSYLLAAAKKIKVLVTEAINMIIVLWFAASGWSRRRQQLRDSWAKNRVWSQMWVHIRSTYLIYCHYKCQDGTLICHWAAYDGRRECLCCNAILRSNQTRICIFVRYTSRPSRYKNISIIIFLQYFLIALFDVALIACISGVFISAVKYSKPV